MSQWCAALHFSRGITFIGLLHRKRRLALASFKRFAENDAYRRRWRRRPATLVTTFAVFLADAGNFEAYRSRTSTSPPNLDEHTARRHDILAGKVRRILYFSPSPEIPKATMAAGVAAFLKSRAVVMFTRLSCTAPTG